MDPYSTNTCVIFMPLLTRSYSVQHVPGAGCFPAHPGTAEAPLHRAEQSSVSPRGHPRHVRCTLRPSAAGDSRGTGCSVPRMVSHLAVGALHLETLTSKEYLAVFEVPALAHGFFARVGPAGSHGGSATGCPQGGLCWRGALGVAGVWVLFVRLPGPQASCSRARVLGHRPDFCPAV